MTSHSRGSADTDQRALAIKVAEQASEQEREALLHWMVHLLQIRESSLSATKKAKLALQLTYKSKVIWPVVKMVGREVKRHGWDERGTKARYGLVGTAAGILLFGSQGAGIAALGTAVGVPLWAVLGAGAAFAAPFIERLYDLVPKDRHPQPQREPLMSSKLNHDKSNSDDAQPLQGTLESAACVEQLEASERAIRPGEHHER